MEEIFENIIKSKKWKKTICGSGSTLKYTANLRNHLVQVLESLQIKSMLDAPCGDYSWMSTINFPKNVKYIGADIVDFMVKENKKNFPDIEFLTLDITQDKLPNVDLMFCRDCLLHLPLKDIDNFFINFLQSNIKYLGMSNWYEKFNNFLDIQPGNSRYLNFLIEPYNFKEPIFGIDDYIKGFPKRKILFWDRNTLLEKYNK